MKLTLGPLVSVFACTTTTTVAPRTTPIAPVKTSPQPAAPHAVIDVIGALAGNGERSTISPGPLQLELGATPIQPAREGDQIDAIVLDDQGGLVRVGIRLPSVRFAAWIERARIYAVVTHDTRVSGRDGSDFTAAGREPVEATLHAGARVRRLAHERGWTRVRYFGQLEVEGWVADDALAEHGPLHDAGTRAWHGGNTLNVVPGSVIRTEPTWSARALATTANGYFVEEDKAVDDSWTIVTYEDGDVRVRGYLSRHDPPGRVHRPHETEGAQTIAPNGKLPAGTCLYAHEGGEAIGYVVVDSEAELAAGGTGWFAAAVDTPWGPITFAARGPTEAELEKCTTAP